VHWSAYRKATSYEGALLRMKDIPRGYIVLSSEVNEVRRQRLLSGTKSATTSCRSV
jgi:hypothetical protein